MFAPTPSSNSATAILPQRVVPVLHLSWVSTIQVPGDGRGKGHLVCVEEHMRNKELMKLQQKMVALLVKGNDHARRR